MTHWTPQERQQVLDEALRILREQKGFFLSYRDLWWRAEELLSEDRRRRPSKVGGPAYAWFCKPIYALSDELGGK